MPEPVVLKDEAGVVIVRIGSTVRRPAGPSTATVQSLLAHLRAAGFTRAPVPFGLDEHGRDVVSYLHGESGPACWSRIVTDQGLRRFGSLLRDYHQAVASFVAADDACWKVPGGEDGPDTVLCHGDFAPWNVVWQGNEPVGVIDWELAHPANRFDDLAWAAIWSIPLRSDDEAVTGWDCWPAPPDRRPRLQTLIEAYGDGTPADVVDRAAAVLRRTFRDVTRLAAQGWEPQRGWVRSGVARRDLDRADWIDANCGHLTGSPPSEG